MIGLESLSSEYAYSNLSQEANAYSKTCETQHASPIESKETGVSNETSQLQGLEVTNEAQLNTPIESKEAGVSNETSQLQGLEVTNEAQLNTPIEQQTVNEPQVLSIEEKKELQATTDWSDKTTYAIKTKEEASIYQKAGLKEVNGNLERTDINWQAKIPQNIIDKMRTFYGNDVANKWGNMTNKDLIKEGKAPYGSDGKRINLHHIGQKADSPLAELTDTEHKSNDSILHDKTKESEIKRSEFRKEREDYWRNRYEALIK